MLSLSAYYCADGDISGFFFIFLFTFTQMVNSRISSYPIAHCGVCCRARLSKSDNISWEFSNQCVVGTEHFRKKRLDSMETCFVSIDNIRDSNV